MIKYSLLPLTIMCILLVRLNLISILLFGGRTFNSKSDAYRQDCILLCNGFFNTIIEHTKDTAFHFSHIIMQ